MGRSESKPDTEVPETEAIDCYVLIGGGLAGCGAAYEAAFWAKGQGLRAVVCAAGGATNIWRPHAVGDGGVFRGSHAIGPCVDNYWLTLG